MKVIACSLMETCTGPGSLFGFLHVKIHMMAVIPYISTCPLICFDLQLLLQQWDLLDTVGKLDRMG